MTLRLLSFSILFADVLVVSVHQFPLLLKLDKQNI
jgi:hypothetical protein